MSEHEGPTDPAPDWPFLVPKRMAVLIERAVMERRRPIAYVYRDLDDEGFQFVSDGGKTEAGAMMVSLEEVYELDPTIGQLADLQPGWRAVRQHPGQEWAVAPFARGRGHGLPPGVWFARGILLFAGVGFAVFGPGGRSGLERRIEATLPGEPTVGSGETEARDRVRILATLTLVPGEGRSASGTEVEIGGERRLLGPAGRDVDGSPGGVDLWIRDTVSRMKGTQHLTVGEVRVAKGVPREDVRRVADGFLAAGITDVTFAGPPLAAGMK